MNPASDSFKMEVAQRQVLWRGQAPEELRGDSNLRTWGLCGHVAAGGFQGDCDVHWAVNLERGSRLFPGAWPLGAGECLGAESIVVVLFLSTVLYNRTLFMCRSKGALRWGRVAK